MNKAPTTPTNSKQLLDMTVRDLLLLAIHKGCKMDLNGVLVPVADQKEGGLKSFAVAVAMDEYSQELVEKAKEIGGKPGRWVESHFRDPDA